MDLSIHGRPSLDLDIPARRRCLFVSAPNPVDLSYRGTIGITSCDRNSSFNVPLQGVCASPVLSRPLADNQRNVVSLGSYGSKVYRIPTATETSDRPPTENENNLHIGIVAGPGGLASSSSSFGASLQGVSALTASGRPLAASPETYGSIQGLVNRIATTAYQLAESEQIDPHADIVTGPGGLASSSSFGAPLQGVSISNFQGLFNRIATEAPAYQLAESDQIENDPHADIVIGPGGLANSTSFDAPLQSDATESSESRKGRL